MTFPEVSELLQLLLKVAAFQLLCACIRALHPHVELVLLQSPVGGPMWSWVFWMTRATED